MKVAIEASDIGRGFLEPDGRVGIFRVSMSLVEKMLEREELELFFTFLFLPHSMELSAKFFKKKGYDIKALFENTSLERIFYRILTDLPRFPHKYGMMLYPAMLLQLPKKKILPDDIDIYHSLHFPLPDCIDPKKHTRFITVHDIIFVLFPEYCLGFQKKRIKNVIKSIDIDHDWAICVSQCTKNDLCEATGISEGRTFVIYLGASKDIYYPINNLDMVNNALRKLGIPTENDYFLSVATIEPRKNLMLSIRCFKKVLNEPGLSDMYFVIVGRRGWKIDNLFKEVHSDPLLRKHVIFTGFIPDEHLASIYNGALAFVYPSLYEGFGLPPLEAMQCGTPVITSNTSSLPEVVGDAGVMIGPKDEDALCQAMIDIAKDNRLREQLSIKGIKQASGFSWEKCVDETINAYKFALENG